ncbi:hypothetical protein DSO57_1028472 [Entomophthora muscae]|uniref:Uncharacterized protein n=1 Tax=Entomophthora muscae TaxID=34485 RepID=A0ACC2TCS2_9FUNG|nr:hypothetical protein DSO57_1028472 [Entomophthora muscae]
MSQNSQLAWAQMQVILAHMHQRLDDNQYLLPAHKRPMVNIQRPAKHPCRTDPSCSTHTE